MHLFLLAPLLALIQFVVAIRGEMSCNEAVSVITKHQLIQVQECTNKMKFKNLKDREARQTCVLKCVFQENGLIDRDGLYDLIGSLIWVETHLPSVTHAKARELGMRCYKDTIHLENDEVSCKTYDPLYKCSLDLVNSLCD